MSESEAVPASRSLRRAREIADEVLFPAAPDVDGADRVPGSHLDLLAAEGFYGLAAPEDLATLDLPDYPAVLRLVEALAGGCLTTAFVWIQHHGAVMALAETANEALRAEHLADHVSGRRRAGLAVGAAVRPGPPLVRAERADGGWLFEGVAPWVTGWGMVDTLYAAGRDADDTVVWALLDAEESATLSVGPVLDLVAVQASRTVTLRFDRHFVPDERVLGTTPQQEYLKGDAESVRFTGSLALGLAERAITLLDGDAGRLPDELDQVRARLLSVDPDQVPDVRAAGSELALRAASACAVAHGSRAVLLQEHAQRLVREATFLLLFGSRPGIRTALLDRLTTPRN
ncbi:acyl-CoA dehydrogenase family protein [Streptomyces luteolus]|uniref:Acyl-CoA dehydrogenase family protein n=1 Tax=Streptomyces luteolus TaxID=3043615 RepID=A0ABT6T7Y0_9ACTN|nr:acyl-CoA dehydrogenase family protein [Streptomyces sp. B-S-A12]MDI3424003.1 acyl-CoA dehydrogenase family protein [Streptomyces sp. B-S-A12]